MSTTIPVQIKCPQCGRQYSAQVESIIDVGQDPEAKALLLGGALNTVVCPVCGTRGRVSTPLVYHDPDKNLLLVFVPPELNLPMAERERLTGSLVSALMGTVPPEARKAYFLNPRNVLTMQGLVDEILKADGITPDMIEKQHTRSRLLQTLLGAMNDREHLNELVHENSAEIDYPFLLMVSTAAEASAAAEQPDLAEKLLQLRDILMEQTTVKLPEALPAETPTAEVVERMIATPDRESRWAMVLYNRPLLDYAFFQELTARIERAEGAEAESLRNLRTELLDMIARADKAAKDMQREKVDLLEAMLAAPDPGQALRERREEVDTIFMGLLNAARQQAEQSGDTEEAAQLNKVYDAAVAMLRENLPPELRLVNELMTTPPEDLDRVLDENRGDLNAEFVETLDTLAADLDTQGRPELAQYLRELRGRVQAKMAG